MRQYLYICKRFFYAGIPYKYTDAVVYIRDAALVLDTGPMTKPHWNEADWIGECEIFKSEIEACIPTAKTIKPDETRNDLRRTDISLIGKNKRVASVDRKYEWAPKGAWGG